MKYDAEDRFALPIVEDGDVLLTTLERSICPPGGSHVPQHIAIVGCFRPRLCGIATYTADVHDHLLRERPGMQVDIYAMRTRRTDPVDGAVVRSIDCDDSDAYRAAADAINASGAEVVWLQHEFGIFGGPDGELVLELVDRIAAPLVVTLHTILPDPSERQRQIMQRLVARASRLVSMSDHGQDLLTSIYGADRRQVVRIEHGTPDRPFEAVSPLRRKLGIENRPVLSTFGLIGPGKGLENAIRALPAIAARHPDVLYRIVGATHPNLIAHEGESYRASLEALAEELGVTGNIAWENRFLDTLEFLDQIELCDIYLAPYPNLAQITSGTLAYAVALGRAVVSTPFVHARELLAQDVGVLLPDASSEAISAAVLDLLADPAELAAVRQRAYRRGRQTAWPAVAAQSAALLAEVAVHRPPRAPRNEPAMDAVRLLSDDTGILQHATGVIPDRAHGYCIDDNARALMLENLAGRTVPPMRDKWAMRYAAFVQHAWNADRQRFRNFMSFDRRWLEDEGSEDSNGRALWALGHTAARARTSDIGDWAMGLFDRTAPIVEGFGSPRAIAFAMLGACEVLDRDPAHELARSIASRGAEFLRGLHQSASRPDWIWFEDCLAYDNARLSEALIRAALHLREPEYRAIGLATLEWLCGHQTGTQGQFRPVGSQGFGRAGDVLPFDQQPVDAWATIDGCAAAYSATRAELWVDAAEAAWAWFHGANDRGLALADPASGRCRDGVTPRGINANAGAESVLAFHLAYRTMKDLFWSRGVIQKAGSLDADQHARPLASQDH